MKITIINYEKSNGKSPYIEETEFAKKTNMQSNAIKSINDTAKISRIKQ